MIDPFDGRTEMDAADYTAWLAQQGRTVFVPPVETAPDWQTSEKAFMQRVSDYATAHGHDVYHTWKSANSSSGFPDLVFKRGGQVRRVAELKIPPNKVTKDQREWLDAFAAAGIPADVWTPEMWQEIERILG